MLNEAVKNLKGISTIEDFNTSIDLEADAYIPATYIVNEVQNRRGIFSTRMRASGRS